MNCIARRTDKKPPASFDTDGFISDIYSHQNSLPCVLDNLLHTISERQFYSDLWIPTDCRAQPCISPKSHGDGGKCNGHPVPGRLFHRVVDPLYPKQFRKV